MILPILFNAADGAKDRFFAQHFDIIIGASLLLYPLKSEKSIDGEIIISTGCVGE